MNKIFRPDFIFESALEITANFYKENGIKAVIFDIDDTLCPHGEMEPTETAKAVVEAAREAGVRVAFLSNNKKERNEFYSPLTVSANKPSKRGYLAVCREFDVKAEETLSVGDQIFTDVWGANRAGMKSALVTPISDYKNPIIAIKRLLEKPLLRKYKGK